MTPVKSAGLANHSDAIPKRVTTHAVRCCSGSIHRARVQLKPHRNLCGHLTFHPQPCSKRSHDMWLGNRMQVRVVGAGAGQWRAAGGGCASPQSSSARLGPHLTSSGAHCCFTLACAALHEAAQAFPWCMIMLCITMLHMLVVIVHDAQPAHLPFYLPQFLPSLLQQLFTVCAVLKDGSEDSSASGIDAALLVEVPPVAWLQASAMGGSLPCVVEWLPAPPHDLLLVLAFSPPVMGWALPCCAVLCCAVLCCAVLCCAVLCCFAFQRCQFC